MARPRQVSDADILAGARRCFLEHGPSVSTTAIASAVGLSQAALFKRFGTKDDLMNAALLPPELPDWVRHVEAGVDERPITEQLLDIATRTSAFFTEVTPCLMTLKASGADMRALMSRYDIPPPVRGHLVLTAWFAQALASDRIGACDPPSVAYMFLGSLHGRAFLNHVGGIDSRPASSFLEEIVSTLWMGLAPAEAR